MAQTQNNAVVIDMGTPAAPGAAAAAPGTTPVPDKKASDTLFGPNIGVLGGGPAWTESGEKSSDVLTPDIVKNWIAKSKEVSGPTCLRCTAFSGCVCGDTSGRCTCRSWAYAAGGHPCMSYTYCQWGREPFPSL